MDQQSFLGLVFFAAIVIVGYRAWSKRKKEKEADRRNGTPL